MPLAPARRRPGIPIPVRVVERAKEAVDNRAASVEALSVLRSDLEDRRNELTELIAAGSIQGRVITAQIEALGPAPGDGETEPDDIAARREELRSQRSEAMRPIRDAQEKLSETELLLDELDRLIRQKATGRLLHRYPSVLAPGTLATAQHEVSALAWEFRDDSLRAFRGSQFHENRVQLIVMSVLLFLTGLFLIIVARPIAARFFDRRFERSSGAYRYLWAVLSSVTSLVVPLIGAVAIALILPSLNIHSRITDYSGRYVFLIIMVLVLANWLGQTIFSPEAPGRRLIDMPDDLARRGLRLCQALGLVSAIDIFLEAAASALVRDDATVSVIATPVICVGALLMWWLAGVLSASAAPENDQPDEPDSELANQPSGRSLQTLLPHILRIVAVVSVPLVLVGYVLLARHISNAAMMTAALAGVALFLYSVLLGSIRAILRRGRRSESLNLPLLPFTIGTLIGLAMLPLLAIIWGAQVNDVLEVWRLVIVGFQVGDMRISLGVVVSLLVAFVLGTILTRWLQHSLRDTVLPSTKLDAGARNAVVTGVGYVGLTVSALVAFSAAGLSLSSLAVVAGALSLGIGFGMQTIVSNFVSGIILLIERPIAEGDWIEVSGYSGTVKKIAVRSTQISTFDRHDVIVPNQDLIGGVVKNMTLSSRHGRLIIPVGVAYGSDLDKTKEILETAAREQPTLLQQPPPVVLFRGLGDSSLDLELRCYLRNVDDMVTTQSDLLFRIYKGLTEAEIEIPFPQRDITIRGITPAEIRQIEAAGDAGDDPAGNTPDDREPGSDEGPAGQQA